MQFKKALTKAIPAKTARFFTPGHKGTLSPLDVTETHGTDDLHSPNGIIAEAQQRAANAFNAAQTFFLTGGSTLGNQTMIYAAFLNRTHQTNKILVNAHCHVSVTNTCRLLGLTPIFVEAPTLPHWNVQNAIPAAEIAQALAAHPDSLAVLVTSPTYFGVCSDIPPMSAICRFHNVPLLIDQAHGAHLPFHPKLPLDAMSAGADLCTQSAHKTLPALTQTAYLHRHASSIIPAAIVQEALNVFQTTSPSYLFIESLDSARQVMEEEGEKRLEWLIKECKKVRKNVTCLEGKNIDVTRLVFKGDEHYLRKKGIWIEQQFDDNTICIPTICNTKKDFRRLIKCVS